MNSLLAKLPAFALPFVTRSLRGGRGKRYVTISLLIAAATVLLGLWLALGRGSFEQSLRVDVGLENDEWIRQQREFVVFVHDDAEQRVAEREARRIEQLGPYADQSQNLGELAMIRSHGWTMLQRAAWSGNTLNPEHVALREQARELLDPDHTQNWSEYQYFSWTNGADVALLERVIEERGIPEIRRYESPLGLGDALMLIGFLSGLILSACATVFAPLLVAVQQAQERHENTLTPLTGTALSPRELVLGLAAGPSVVVLIFAVPQLALYVGCALLVGELLVALSLLVALASSGLFLIFAGQLLGHLVGHRRTPGIVAIALMCLLGVAWLIGAGMLAEIDREIAGFPAVMPTLGLASLLAASFGELPISFFDTLHVATLAWSAAALVFAGLTVSALSHKIAGQQGAPLRRGSAVVGALTCIGLINLAIPLEAEDGLRFYLGLAGLALPFFILLMARVPVGDEPPRMRRVPVAHLLAEFASWGVAHMLVALVLSPFGLGTPFGIDHLLHPLALLWIGWCVVVLGLIAIRVVSIPASIPAHLFVGFCGATLIMGFLQAIVFAFERDHALGDVFALSRVSPVLGLIQVAVTFGVPLLLLRSLRNKLGSLRSA